MALNPNSFSESYLAMNIPKKKACDVMEKSFAAFQREQK